ncbi:MAG: DNA-3-methyladenine glycosylase I [Bacteroidales bacterium]
MKELMRCPWCGNDPLYVKYHDTEWGVPVYDDLLQFEFLVLESMQAGLSWITILRKRENFRLAFENFSPEKVALFDEAKIMTLMQDPGIIRNEQKIRAAVNNANRFLEVQKEFGTFSKYIWSFTDQKPVVNKWENLDQVPAKTPLSDKVSLDLKKRGFKFLGSTTVYAHMQAVGMVNDHITACFRHPQNPHFS